MKILAPFAGPVSFPILVLKAKKYKELDLANSCISSEKGDVILDSITNLAKLDYIEEYRIVADVYITMYSLIGKLDSDTLYTVKEGTLADYNARLYALKIGKKVINTDPVTAVKKALEEGYLALIGNEIRVNIMLDEEFRRLVIYVPECLIAVKERIDKKEILRIYEEGIDLIKSDYEKASEIIVSSSSYYTLDVMRQIIKLYNHKITTNKDELRRAVRFIL